MTWVDGWLIGGLVAVILWSNLRRIWLRRKWRIEAEATGNQEPPRSASAYPALIMSITYTAALGLGWWYSDRPWSALGFGWSGGFVAACAVAVAVAYPVLLGRLLVGAVHGARTNPEELAALRALATRLRRSQFKVSLTPVVVITVGIWEELCFRGYLYWLLTEQLGLAWGFVLCSLAFGLGHISQGPRILAVTTGLGAAFTALRMLSGSVLVPAFVHATHNAIVAWCVTTVERLPDVEPVPGATSASGDASGAPSPEER